MRQANTFALCNSLRKVKKDGWRETVRWMDSVLKEAPYELPKAYSLESEKKILGEMSGRLKVLRGGICTNDYDALFLDWANIGKDMKGAIREYRGTAAGDGPQRNDRED